MCRSIRVLSNFEPPATDDEIRAAALQYVRKVAGMAKPSRDNTALFEEAVEAITRVTHDLVHGLRVSSAPRDRQTEAAKARAKAAARYGGAG